MLKNVTSDISPGDGIIGILFLFNISLIKKKRINEVSSYYDEDYVGIGQIFKVGWELEIIIRITDMFTCRVELPVALGGHAGGRSVLAFCCSTE